MLKQIKMKKIIFALLIAGFFSCEQIEKLDKQMEPDSTDVANEIAEVKKEMALVEHLAKEDKSKLLFTAFGSEPGWTMEIYPTHIKAMLNYGQDSLWINDDFSGVNSESGFEYSADNNNGKIIIKIINESCIDGSKGDKHNRKVEFIVKGKTLTGCGDAN